MEIEDEPAAPESPLRCAARLGDIAELRRLFAAGVDVNTRTEYDAMTPLMVAAHSTDGATVETLAFLLEAGADLYAVSGRGYTAAWYAADNGPSPWDDEPRPILPDQVERLRFLLDAGLDSHEISPRGSSLLSEACRVGDPAKVRLLLERGVPPNPIPFPGQEAPGERLKAALLEEGQLPEQASELIDRVYRPGEFYSFQVPLLQAVESGSAECVRMLLEAGADPNFAAGDRDDSTALANARSPEVARLLLAAGARLDVRTPLSEDVLDSVLANAGESEDELDAGRFAVAQVVLDAGAPLELVSPHGWTRLYRAAFRHHSRAVDFLLARGASLTPNRQLSTPLHAICWQGEYQDEDVNASCERIVRALVAAGVLIEARDDEGRTPLHKAVGGDWANITAVKTLLELGAEPDPVDGYGQSPLHLAAKRGPVECVELLLARGADPLRQDNKLQTPLELARQREQTWQQIAARNEPLPVIREDPEARAARNERELRGASRAYALLREAAIRTRSSRLSS